MENPARDAGREMVTLGLTGRNAELVTDPTDDDLTMHVYGMKVTAVVFFDGELMVRLVGGYGWFDNMDGGTSVFPEDEAPNDLEIELRAALAVETEQDQQFVQYRLEKFERWRDERTLLELSASPKQMMSVISTPGDWIPMLRHKPDPRWIDD